MSGAPVAVPPFRKRLQERGQYGHEVLGLKETEHVATPTDQRSINVRPLPAVDSIAELAVVRSSGQRTRKVERFCRKCVAQARPRLVGHLHFGTHWFVMRVLSTDPVEGCAFASVLRTYDF